MMSEMDIEMKHKLENILKFSEEQNSLKYDFQFSRNKNFRLMINYVESGKIPENNPKSP